MASNPDQSPRLSAPIAVLASAAGWWLGSGLHPMWWLTWLSALPLLAYAVRAGARASAGATFIAFAIGGANMWPYLHDVIRLPLPVCLLAILSPALLMVPPVLLWRSLAKRGHVFMALLAFPLAATGLSWLAAALSPHGTFGHVAYTQMDAPPIIQIAALGGLWAVGFLVWLLPSSLAIAIARCAEKHRRMAAAATGLTLVALALGYGESRLQGNAAESRIRVGLVSIGNSDQAQADLDTPSGQRMLADYLVQMEKLANGGAQLIVAPESALLVRSHAVSALQELATRRNVRILIGVEDHSGPQHKYNTALVFEPGNLVPASYNKRHLIPGFEDRYTPGDATLMLERPASVGVAICKDFDFTTTGLEYGQLQAELMLSPAWDFGNDAWLHSRMAILRGVENGFAIARSARDGYLTLSDDRGRVLAQTSTAGVATAVSVSGDIPLRSTRTFYAHWGDAFGWLCLAAAILLVLRLFIPRSSGLR